MSYAGIQLRFSTNCIAAVAMSKPVSSGMLASSVMKAMPVANQRAAPARWLPKAMVARPPKIGSQISRLSRKEVLCKGSGFTSGPCPS